MERKRITYKGQKIKRLSSHPQNHKWEWVCPTDKKKHTSVSYFSIYTEIDYWIWQNYS